MTSESKTIDDRALNKDLSGSLITEWGDARPADRTEIMAELRHPGRFGGNAKITLVYPGCGWDFTSFWGPADPSFIIMLDPAPVTMSASAHMAILQWQDRMRGQLSLGNESTWENFVFDQQCNEARALREGDWDEIRSQDYMISGPLRPAFSVSFAVRAEPRILTFIAARFEELPVLQAMVNSQSLRIYPGMPARSHIVYEHKSMVSTGELKSGVAKGGCLIWGLPDDAPKVQWSSALR
jgi:hypothetical protein